MLEESIAEVRDDAVADDAAGAAGFEQPARLIQWAEREGYAPSSRARLGSMATALTITFGLLGVITQAGFVAHPAPRSQPLVVDLIALPPPEPPLRRSPVSDTPARVPLPKQFKPVVMADAARPIVVPIAVAAETAPTPPIAPTSPSVTISSTPVPDRSAAAVPASPAVRTADLSVRLLSAPPPRYPIESRRRWEQGDVVLSVLLGTDGRVQDISVVRSSGSGRLDKAALAAVSRWRWSPIIEAGVPAMVRGVVTLPFVLQG